MENPLDLLEEKFQRVEQATERRALYEHEPTLCEPADPLTEPQKHRKPAVLISRFGKQEEQADDDIRSLAPSALSSVVAESTFYHTLVNPRSAESVVNPKDEMHDTQQHEMRVERIAGRQTLYGALLPRRLTRAQSQIDYTSIKRGMIIDVSVETRMESESHFQALNIQTSTAYATPPSRSRAATVGELTSHGGLVERARDFTRKLQRKSKA